MTLRSLFLSLAGFVLAAAMVTYAAREHVQARRQHEAAVASFQSVSADAQEVLRLRGMVQRINDRPRPEQDMIARLHAAMRQAGLDVSRHFQSLRLEGDIELPGAGLQDLRCQSVAVALGGLDLSQLGSLLLQWKRDQPLWDVTRLEMTHARGKDQSADSGYDISLTFSAVYVALGEGAGS